MAELVSNRYALALLEAGIELNRPQGLYRELKQLRDIFQDEIELIKILKHPRIKNKDKINLIDKIFKYKFSQEILNFLYLLVEGRRIPYILEIIDEYIKIYNKHENIVKVVAITAIPLDQKLTLKMINALSKNLNKRVELSNEVNKSIIGGVLLKIEDRQIDGTLKGQLESMAKVIGLQ